MWSGLGAAIKLLSTLLTLAVSPVTVRFVIPRITLVLTGVVGQPTIVRRHATLAVNARS
ncbi:MAG: hypothetical protein AVDCRST_MAG90-2318 [uncultured Microvirga sp.]|uniref:Uncharacterized protein n=1 Tax=uncultured Microvirga sp. TaxID=412392 RepID=A0A6J4M4P5_9HYPH|nr:MAG: hypothetical protein AVDCRST_MAG90-2318 [uncultured Microvirga sp.]